MLRYSVNDIIFGLVIGALSMPFGLLKVTVWNHSLRHNSATNGSSNLIGLSYGVYRTWKYIRHFSCFPSHDKVMCSVHYSIIDILVSSKRLLVL